MGNVWLQGVVKNGQVVLDAPLDLPDGTAIIVTDCCTLEDDPRPKPAPVLKFNDEERAELYLFLDHKKDWAFFPAFEAKLVEKYGPWLSHHFTPRAA